MVWNTGNPLEDSLRVTIGVAIKTAPKSMMTHVVRGEPVMRDAALLDLVDRIATYLSRRYEIGRQDDVSQRYISNYADPR